MNKKSTSLLSFFILGCHNFTVSKIGQYNALVIKTERKVSQWTMVLLFHLLIRICFIEI